MKKDSNSDSVSTGLQILIGGRLESPETDQNIGTLSKTRTFI